MILRRNGDRTVTALSPYGYMTAELQPSQGDQSVCIPLDGKHKAAYYDVRFR